VWAAVIIAIPVAIFGMAEMVSLMRRRRYEALARRSKEIRRRPSSGSRPGRAG
jgi:hypothetical protein